MASTMTAAFVSAIPFSWKKQVAAAAQIKMCIRDRRSDVLFHVLDYLDLLGMEVEPPFFGRGINLLPFGGWQEHIFPTETP